MFTNTSWFEVFVYIPMKIKYEMSIFSIDTIMLTLFIQFIKTSCIYIKDEFSHIFIMKAPLNDVCIKAYLKKNRKKLDKIIFNVKEIENVYFFLYSSVSLLFIQNIYIYKKGLFALCPL